MLHVDTATEWRGGQSLLLRLVRGLAERGEEVWVGCPTQGRLWSELSFLADRRLALPPGVSLRSCWRLWRARPELLVAHSSHAHGCCAVLPVPLVVHRWVDFVPSGGWKYRRPDSWIACTQAVGDIVAQVGGRHISVVHGGTDPVPVVPAAPDAPAVLAVGARVPHKGHDVLAAAAGRLQDVDIGVAGSGPLVFPGLRWLGHRDDIPALLAGARVFVQPSRTEGQGIAVVEAMLAGVPVVASRVGGIPEVLGDTGILVPPEDPAALAEGIAAALAGRHPPIEAARQRAQERFTTDCMVTGALAVYQATLARVAVP